MAQTKRAKVIRAMHDRGFTYEEIGELFGISRQAAWETATKSKNGFNESAVRKIKYEGLRNWMIEHRVNISELERRCGVSKFGKSLYGDVDPRKRNIDAILAVTGLTYEECFKEDNL